MPTDHLVTHIYTADPSAHVFNDHLYIYPSHDIPNETPFNDKGDQYAMKDYHVLSIPLTSFPPTSTKLTPVTTHGPVLTLPDVPWASKQLWAPDAASKNGKYYLYLPARDKDGLFRIGVAVSDKPEGPFVSENEAIHGSFSIDPCVFVDDGVGYGNGQGKDEAYLLFGGIWGGEMQCYSRSAEDEAKDAQWTFDPSKLGPQEPSGPSTLALHPKIAQLTPDMLSFTSPPRDLVILDAAGNPIMADDHDKRFFEGSWLHKYNGKYYFSYSTGDTHYVVYAVGDSPWGPFRYRGRILEPVSGWTTHHSIVEVKGRWWIFYHDCELSKGVDHLRSVRGREIGYDEMGDIYLVD